MRKPSLAWLFPLLFGCGSSVPSSSTPPPTTSGPSGATVAAPIASSPTTSADPVVASAVPVADAPAPSSAPRTPNDFTLDLLRAISSEQSNVLVSGTSIRQALGMVALGARGDTARQLAGVLTLDADPSANRKAAESARAEWSRAAGKSELSIANRMWVDKSFRLEPPFVKLAEDGYGASPASADFRTAADASRNDINRWVSGATRGKIVDLLPPGSVTGSTRLVLTNAVYFKGSWTDAFVASATKDEPFHAKSGDVTVPLMHRTAHMAYAETPAAQMVDLPYKDSDLAMLFVLPRALDGLSSLTRDTTAVELFRWTSDMKQRQVALSLPRFTFSWGGSIKTELKALGITSAFGTEADFSGISAGQGLLISDVFHKTFVKVDEVGTEAAAATGVVMRPTAMRMDEPVVLRFDRPFVFFLRNKRTGEVLFAGRVSNPKA